MADTKLADLTALTTPSGDDILYIVDDPAGTPLDRKIALDNLFTRGTITADAPVLNMSQTWNNAAVTFTGLKFNVVSDTSAAASLLMDLQVGGTSRFNVTKMGGVNIRSIDPTFRLGYLTENQLVINQGVLNVASNFQVGFSSSSIGVTTLNMDTILTRRAAANFRLGGIDTSSSATVTITIAAPGVVTWSNNPLSTGTPVVFSTTGALPTGITAGTTYYAVVVTASTFQIATSFANAIAATPTVVTTSGSQSGTHTIRRGAIAQTLSVQDTLSTGSLENIDGANLVINGSRSIGNKPGGSIIFQVAPAGSSGSAQNGLSAALTIASTNAITVGANGTISFPTSATTLPSAPGIGAWVSTLGIFGSSGALAATVSGININLSSSYSLEWNSDTKLFRDAANTLALRNGNEGQTFRLYGRFTDITNDFERFFINAPTTSGAAVLLGTQKGATTGAARALELQTDGVTRLSISTNGSIGSISYLAVQPSGFTNASILDNNGNVQTVSSGAITFSSSATNAGGSVDTSIKRGGAAGVILLGNSITPTDFGRLQFGGTSSAFPALKRSTTTLQAVLANDGGFTNIQGKLTTDTAYTATVIVPTGYLTLYDSTGTAYRVPCVV